MKDVKSAVLTAHNEMELWNKEPTQQISSTSDSKAPLSDIDAAASSSKTTAVDSLKNTVKLIDLQLLLLEQDRVQGWNSDNKKTQRKRWSEEGNASALSQLQLLNNKVGWWIKEMRGLLGSFVKWRMGVENGLHGIADH